MMTRTFTTYFDTGDVDEHFGALHRKLETDYLLRQSAIAPEVRRAVEARLDFIRAAWTLCLDRVPE